MQGARTMAVLLAALTLGAAADARGVPPELKTPNYRVTQLGGIGHDPRLDRQDPSNVIHVGDRYYVWYTQRKHGVHPYASTVFYATSKDGIHWEDRGEALGKGPKGAWDSFGVITPYVAAIGGTYYLYYTGTTAAKPWKSRGPDGTLRHIGVAVAERPDGPWRRLEGNPVLSPTRGAWDSLIVDDTHLIVRRGTPNGAWPSATGRRGLSPRRRRTRSSAATRSVCGPIARASRRWWTTRGRSASRCSGRPTVCAGSVPRS